MRSFLLAVLVGLLTTATLTVALDGPSARADSDDDHRREPPSDGNRSPHQGRPPPPPPPPPGPPPPFPNNPSQTQWQARLGATRLGSSTCIDTVLQSELVHVKGHSRLAVGRRVALSAHVSVGGHRKSVERAVGGSLQSISADRAMLVDVLKPMARRRNGAQQLLRAGGRSTWPI